MFKDDRTTDEILREHLKRKEKKRRVKGILLAGGALAVFTFFSWDNEPAISKHGEIQAKTEQNNKEAAIIEEPAPVETTEASEVDVEPAEKETVTDEPTQDFTEAMAIFEELSTAKKSMRDAAQALEAEVAVSGNSITYPVSVKSLEPLEMGMDTFSNSLLSIQHVDYPDYLSADITLVGQKYQELKVAMNHLRTLYGEDNKITLTSEEEAKELQAAFRTIADILDFTMTNSQRMFAEYEDGTMN